MHGDGNDLRGPYPGVLRRAKLFNAFGVRTTVARMSKGFANYLSQGFRAAGTIDSI